MDKIKFARMINLLSHWGMRELDQHEMQELDKLTTIVSVPVSGAQLQDIMPQRAVVAEDDVNNLLRLMAAKEQKIDAIKAYRQITNAGLKEAKDAIERYW